MPARLFWNEEDTRGHRPRIQADQQFQATPSQCRRRTYATAPRISLIWTAVPGQEGRFTPANLLRNFREAGGLRLHVEVTGCRTPVRSYPSSRRDVAFAT